MITFRMDAKGLEERLKKFPKIFKYRFVDALDHIGRSFYKRFNPRLEGRPGIIGRPRGIRLRFKRNTVYVKGQPVGLNLHFKSPVAVRHEEGAWMSGPGGRRIAVPLSARAYRVLDSNARIKSKYSYKGRLQGRNRLRPMKFKGQWFLAEVAGKRAKRITPLFVLKDKVWNPARLEFYKTWQGMEPRTREILDDAVAMSCQETNK